MGDWRVQEAKTPGYVSAPDRYYASRVANPEIAPMGSFAEEKLKTTGFVPSPNRYYATRTQLSYHPPSKRFAGSGQVTVQETSSPPPPPPQQTAQVQPSASQLRQKELADYEADYLKRLDESEQQAQQQAQEVAAKASSKGSLPKGF